MSVYLQIEHVLLLNSQWINLNISNYVKLQCSDDCKDKHEICKFMEFNCSPSIDDSEPVVIVVVCQQRAIYEHNGVAVYTQCIINCKFGL